MNKWKVAFFILTGTIILTITIFVIWVTSPVEDVPIPSNNTSISQEDSVFLVETTAADFKKIAMRYLEEEIGNTPIPIDIVVKETITLNSELTVFGVTVPFSMEFDPIVNEEGNIQLKQTSVNVAKLNLPPITVLRLMNDAVPFPPWIVVRPNEEEIFVDLSNLSLMSGSKVRAKEIDLANNRILLEVIVPNE